MRSFAGPCRAVVSARLVAVKWPEFCRRMSTNEKALPYEPVDFQDFYAGTRGPYNASHARGRWFETSRAH